MQHTSWRQRCKNVAVTWQCCMVAAQCDCNVAATLHGADIELLLQCCINFALQYCDANVPVIFLQRYGNVFQRFHNVDVTLRQYCGNVHAM